MYRHKIFVFVVLCRQGEKVGIHQRYFSFFFFLRYGEIGSGLELADLEKKKEMKKVRRERAMRKLIGKNK